MPNALHSKRVLLPDGIKEATIFLEKGIITGVVGGLAMVEGADLVDVGEKVVMPGVIDPHVHINEPGRTDWEGFDTATRAAAAGGLTLLVDMPLNSSPVTTTAAAFDLKRAAAEGKLHCDCGFWGGVVPGNEKDIEPLIGRGVLGFKAFLTHSGIDEFPNVTEADLHKAMPIIAACGLPLLVHCELSTNEGLSGGDSRSYRNYLLSRPSRWEEDAIALMIRLCEQYKCRTHIVHLSSAGAIGPIRRAKERGLPLTVETTQHYLYFSAEEIGDGETYFKCAPPIRERENNSTLWNALREGVIDFVATDHSPAPPAMKEPEGGDLTRAWGGIASLQLSLPVLWTGAERRGFGVGDLVSWLCTSPALLTGQSERRGKIARGYQADIVVWDPDLSFTVEKEGILHRHKGTPYLGEELYGVVAQTWLRGEKIFDKDEGVRLYQGRVVV
ncbi:MAG: allantoinase AllB [Chitinophagaceae bacterium]|nr:allantoinase AllB [Chitinophagaceae bacterium]